MHALAKLNTSDEGVLTFIPSVSLGLTFDFAGNKHSSCADNTCLDFALAGDQLEVVVWENDEQSTLYNTAATCGAPRMLPRAESLCGGR